MSKQTAMQQLLTQMREERSKLPIPIEWCRCYQAIEMMIHHTYLQMEREQIQKAFVSGDNHGHYTEPSQYYNQTYGGNNE